MGEFVGHELFLNLDLDALDDFKVDFPGEFGEIAGDINQDISELVQQFKDAGDEILPRVSDSSVQLQRSEIMAFNSVVTGTLLESIQVISGGTEHVRIGSQLDRAFYVDEGRGEVYPKKEGGVLAFFTKDGEFIVTDHVEPAEPRPYASTSDAILDTEIDEIVDDLLGGI